MPSGPPRRIPWRGHRPSAAPIWRAKIDDRHHGSGFPTPETQGPRVFTQRRPQAVLASAAKRPSTVTSFAATSFARHLLVGKGDSVHVSAFGKPFSFRPHTLRSHPEFGMGVLAGKIVIITGASSGIGEAAALMFAREGAALGLGARRKSELEALASRIGAGLVALALDRFGRLACVRHAVQVRCFPTRPDISNIVTSGLPITA